MTTMTETYEGSHRGTVPNVDGVEVGDIFYSSWGYDQTNTDYAVIVGLTAKRVKLQECDSMIVRSDGSGSESVAPNLDTLSGEVQTKRVQTYGSTPTLYRNSYSNWYKWDGKPKHQTSSGWGH